MTVLSIDQSLRKSGLAFFKESELQFLSLLKTDKELDQVASLSQFLHEFRKLLDKVQAGHSDLVVVVEGMSFGSVGPSVRVLAGVYFLIALECFWRGIPFYEIPPQTIKKFATGKGNTKGKKPLFENLPEKVQADILANGWTSEAKGKYDVTDAYWIGRCFLSKHRNGDI